MDELIDELKLDRTAVAVFHTFEEADAADRDYWFSRTPEERLHQMEVLRRLNYGTRATERLQRILEFAPCPWG